MNINNINGLNFTSTPYYLKGETLDRLAILTRDMEYLKAIKDGHEIKIDKIADDKDFGIMLRDSKEGDTVEITLSSSPSDESSYGEIVEIDPVLYAQTKFQDSYKLKHATEKKLSPSEITESTEKIKKQTPPQKRVKLDIKA